MLWILGFYYNFVRKKVYFWCKVRFFYFFKFVLIVVMFFLSLYYFSKFFSLLIFYLEVVFLSWEKNFIFRVYKCFILFVLVFFNWLNYMGYNVVCSKRFFCWFFFRLYMDIGCSGLGGYLLFGWFWRVLFIFVGFSWKVVFENLD